MSARKLDGYIHVVPESFVARRDDAVASGGAA